MVIQTVPIVAIGFGGVFGPDDMRGIFVSVSTPLTGGLVSSEFSFFASRDFDAARFLRDCVSGSHDLSAVLTESGRWEACFHQNGVVHFMAPLRARTETGAVVEMKALIDTLKNGRMIEYPIASGDPCGIPPVYPEKSITIH